MVACPACAGRWPAADDRIVDLGRSTAYLHADQFFPGWTLLVLNRHAVELYDLEPAERGALVDELARVARVLAALFEAVKMNYALLGNQIAHVHWHLIPRRADDPLPREPVWSLPHAPVALAPDVRRDRIAALRSALAR